MDSRSTRGKRGGGREEKQNISQLTPKKSSLPSMIVKMEMSHRTRTLIFSESLIWTLTAGSQSVARQGVPGKAEAQKQVILTKKLNVHNSRA